jgi:hypothetical protein
VISIALDETVLAETGPEPGTGVRVIIRTPTPVRTGRTPTPTAVLDRRLAIARAIVHAHNRGATPERLRHLDAAYLATRMPLDEGETYDE